METNTADESRGEIDLALRLKCFPPSPDGCPPSIYQSNDVAKGQVDQAQLLLLSFETDSDSALLQLGLGLCSLLTTEHLEGFLCSAQTGRGYSVISNGPTVRQTSCSSFTPRWLQTHDLKEQLNTFTRISFLHLSPLFSFCCPWMIRPH